MRRSRRGLGQSGARGACSGQSNRLHVTDLVHQAPLSQPRACESSPRGSPASRVPCVLPRPGPSFPENPSRTPGPPARLGSGNRQSGHAGRGTHGHQAGGRVEAPQGPGPLSMVLSPPQGRALLLTPRPAPRILLGKAAHGLHLESAAPSPLAWFLPRPSSLQGQAARSRMSGTGPSCPQPAQEATRGRNSALGPPSGAQPPFCVTLLGSPAVTARASSMGLGVLRACEYQSLTEHPPSHTHTDNGKRAEDTVHHVESLERGALSPSRCCRAGGSPLQWLRKQAHHARKEPANAAQRRVWRGGPGASSVLH